MDVCSICVLGGTLTNVYVGKARQKGKWFDSIYGLKLRHLHVSEDSQGEFAPTSIAR